MWNHRFRQRPLRVQQLESRNLLTAQISELLISPLFGDVNTDQMIELRGEANQTLDPGTYLVVVEEHGPTVGEIHGIFDLSGQSFGSNGYLVLLQQDSPHQPLPGTSVLQSSAEGFGGLPDNLYTDSHSLSDRIDFIVGANTYMLIQTDVAPSLEQNIDADEDGLIDPSILSQWNILDSISLHPFVGGGDVAYGKIVFATEGSSGPREITVPSGVAVAFIEGFGYAGRVGESTGSTTDDWVASTVVNEASSEEPERWALADNLFGVAEQFPFAGRDLDHVGGPNFVGGVRGVVRNPSTGVPLAGVPVLADTNGNGVRDNLQFVVSPDDVVASDDPEDQEYHLINAYPGVTITNYALDSFPAFDVTSEFETDFPDTLTNRIFAKSGIDWFSNNGVLRFDFYRPASSVSIVAIAGDNSLTEVFGRIEAYDIDGQLIGTDVSSLLTEGETETIEVSSASANIAYAFAYADTEHEVGGVQGSPFGRFDTFRYTQPEPMAITDSQGRYEISRLFPERLQPAPIVSGFYQIQPLATGLTTPPVSIEVTKHEHFVIDFSPTENEAPVLQPDTFEISEASSPGTAVGQINASDANGEAITFRLEPLSDEFIIDANSGLISVGPNANLDFETSNRYELTVIGQDTSSSTGQAIIVIELTDVNEPPEIVAEPITIRSDAAATETIGSLSVDNPEAGQQIIYEVTGGSGQTYFQIDSQSGAISIRQSLDLNEHDDELTLDIRATDDGLPPQSATSTITIRVEPAIEPPLVETEQLSVSELAESFAIVAAVVATNPNSQGELRYAITGGSGQGTFTIGEETGIVKVAEDANLDFETTNQYSLLVTVSVTDLPDAVITQEIVVLIEDEIEGLEFTSTIDPQTASVGSQFELDLPSNLVVDPEGGPWLIEALVDGKPLPAWLEFDSEQMRFRGIPSSSASGSLDVTLHAYLPTDPESGPTLLFQIDVQISEKPLHNLVTIHDVNGDREVTALDALRIINFIARVGDESTPVDQDSRADAFYDVSGDNVVSALDALRVINELARLLSDSEAQIEPSQMLARPIDGRPTNQAQDHRDRALEQILDEIQLF